MNAKTIDRRKYSRTQVERGRAIEVDRKWTMRVQNISLGGLCFKSEQQFASGTEITVGNRLFHITAEVLACHRGEREQGNSSRKALVRCRFLSTTDHVQERMLLDCLLGMESTTGQSLFSC